MTNQTQQEQYLVVNADKHEIIGIWFGLNVAVDRALTAATKSGHPHAVYKLVGDACPVHEARWAPVDDQEGSTP
jgi:hypothetical protein